MIIDLSAVSMLDSTGASMIEGLARKTERRRVAFWITGARRDMRRTLITHGVRPPHCRYAVSIDDALARHRARTTIVTGMPVSAADIL